MSATSQATSLSTETAKTLISSRFLTGAGTLQPQIRISAAVSAGPYQATRKTFGAKF